MKSTYTFIIFSANIVFIEVLKRILTLNCYNCEIITFTSFSQAQEISNVEAQAIIVDDRIKGSTSLELISHLRIRTKIAMPIYYFSVAGIAEEKKALLNGVNFFFEKPFYPDLFVKHLKKTIAYI
jgi:DNA-binding NtrC family response regulator